MNTELTIVPLEKATNAELILAAVFAGAGEAEPDVSDIVDEYDLNQEQRQALITYLNAVGFYNIQIDPNERVDNPDALIPFNVALPM
jgi:hypothetical protein